MSAFLGPIHTWLYNKITVQNELVDTIIEQLKELEDIGDVELQLKGNYGIFPTGNLEDIVDDTNIHGWLQDKVSLVENRLAFLVTANPSNLQKMIEITHDFGKTYGTENELSVKEAYLYLDRLLLNGMPCDHVNVIESETDQCLQWKQAVDIHKSYWEMINGTVDYFYQIREAFIKGIFSNDSICFTSLGNQRFELRKE